MPRGGAHEPCKECGSTTRHKQGCSKPGRGGSAPAPRVAKSAMTPVTAALAGKTVPELVEERKRLAAAIAQLDEELRRQKALLDGALGEAA